MGNRLNLLTILAAPLAMAAASCGPQDDCNAHYATNGDSACSFSASYGGEGNASAESGDRDADLYQLSTAPDGQGFDAQFVAGPHAYSVDAYVSHAWPLLEQGADIVGVTVGTSSDGPGSSTQSITPGGYGPLKITSGFRYGYVGGCIKKVVYYHATRVSMKGLSKPIYDLHVAIYRKNNQSCIGVYNSAGNSKGVCSCWDENDPTSVINELRVGSHAKAKKAVRSMATTELSSSYQPIIDPGVMWTLAGMAAATVVFLPLSAT